MNVMTPEDFARIAAQAVRDLNHATRANPQPSISYAGLEYPGDAYATVADLKHLAQRLPQTFTQLCGFLKTLYAAGHLTADHGSPDAHLSQAEAALNDAATAAETLANALNRAHSALGPIGYSE